MYIAKHKQTYIYRKQTSGCKWGRGIGEVHVRGMGLRDTNYFVQNR